MVDEERSSSKGRLVDEEGIAGGEGGRMRKKLQDGKVGG